MAVGAKQDQVVVAVQILAATFKPPRTASGARHDVTLLSDDGSIAFGSLVWRDQGGLASRALVSRASPENLSGMS